MRQQGYRVPVPREELRAAPAGYDPRRQVCDWCGGAGAHYLTCKTLRLPAGYRVSDDPRRRREFPAVPAPPGAGLIAGGRPTRRRAPGGPDHPDWPGPPRGDS